MRCLFRRIWFQMKQLPICCIVLVGINVLMFLADIFSGYRLTYMGGEQKTAILEQGEYIRLLWAMFLHADIAHLSNNMIVLFFLGSVLEKETGHLPFLIIYFLSGLLGNIVSLAVKVMQNSEVMSIGASGAIFGLDGLLLTLVILMPKFRETMPLARVFLMILLSVYDGYVADHVDNAAHLGGLIIGFVTGMIYVVLRQFFSKRKEVTW